MSCLFEADIFSNPDPVFNEVSAEAENRVSSIISSRYPSVPESVERVEKFGGNEVASNNFRVETEGGTLLLKRISPDTDVPAFHKRLELCQWLNAKSLPVPGVHVDRNGDHITGHSGELWCLFPFIDGTFFSGRTDRECGSAAKHIGRLIKNLKKVPDKLALPQTWTYCPSADDGLMEGMRKRKSDWDEFFGSEIAVQLAEEWDYVEAKFSELKSGKEHIEASPKQVCHTDLHPHNILIYDEELATFLDFEAFNVINRGPPLAWGVYKLIRQSASARKLGGDPGAINRMGVRFVEVMRKELGVKSMKSERMQLFASAEIMRRIMIIFRLNLHAANPCWNHVLGMQLDGLREVDIVLGSID
jgi:aminoglycoside phosphotransferase (APT) family kinase protein